MATHSYTMTCPNCGMDADACEETRPFSRTTFMCYNCGLFSNVTLEYLSPEELNLEREMMDMKPLEQPPKQNEIFG